MAPDHLDVTARTRMERVVNLRSLPLVAGTMSLFRVVEGWETQLGSDLNGAMFVRTRHQSTGGKRNSPPD